MRIAPVAAFTLALAALGCETSTTSPGGNRLLDAVGDGPVTAVVAEAEAAPGANVSVTFANSGAAEYWFNPCEREVQRESGGEWVSLGQELRICNEMAYVLAANGERAEMVDVPAFIEPGRYRFVFTMRPSASGDVATRPASSAFEVK